MASPDRAASDERLGPLLLAVARGALDEAVTGRAAAEPPADPRLDRPAATFVTLKIGDRLRGCIGSLYPTRALRDDVRSNARAAALDDPRFPAVEAGELDGVTVEVSLLSPLEPLEVASEAELVALLEPGVDGLYLEESGCRGTFLPQVWDSLPDPSVFLAHLRRKAGLAGDHWSPDLRFWRFSVKKWSEAG